MKRCLREKKNNSWIKTSLFFVLFSFSILSLQANSLSLQDALDTDIHGLYQGKSPAHFEAEMGIVFAEFLYWQAQEDNLDFAAHLSANGTNVKQKIKDVEQHWNPGVRVGVGYDFGCHDQWDITAYWTYFRGTANNSSSFPGKTNLSTRGQGFLTPTWGGGVLGTTLSKASGHWAVNLNLADLELGKNFFLSQAIAIRPFIAIRGASIDQNYTANYLAVYTIEDSSVNEIDVSAPTRMRAHNDYLGMGPRIGADFIWHINCHWGLVAKFSGSLLYGRFYVDQDFDGYTIDNTGTFSVLDIAKFKWDNHFNRVRANFEESLGVQCEWQFRKWNCTIALLYEFAQWFEQNQLQRTTLAENVPPTINPIEIAASRQSTDLGLSGLTLELRCGF